MICLAAAIPALLLMRTTAGPDLFDLVPKVPRLDGYVILAWPDLERARHALNAGAVSSGVKLRALGYMMDGDQPVRDGERVERFFLLPDAGNALHPAHRFGDQMIDVRLEAGNTVCFSERSLVWVWGTLRTLPGDPVGHDPLYVLESARTDPADKADILKHFRW